MCKVKKVLNINKQNKIICYEQGESLVGIETTVQRAVGLVARNEISWQGGVQFAKWAVGTEASVELAVYKKQLAVGLVARNEVSWPGVL